MVSTRGVEAVPKEQQSQERPPTHGVPVPQPTPMSTAVEGKPPQPPVPPCQQNSWYDEPGHLNVAYR
jgi:hypothetical protein